MSKDLKSFQFEDHQIRLVMRDGEPWFVAVDVCQTLEHTNARKALQRLDEDEKGVTNGYTLGGIQTINIVSEAGLYHLILTARTEKAKPFRRWVTHEVLPTLRRTGGYAMPGARSKLARQADGFVETGRLFRSSMKALRAVGINNTLAANLANEAAASLVGIDVAEATRRKRYQLPDGAAVVGPHSVTWLDPAAQAPRRVAETIWLGDHIARFRAAVDDYEADE